MLCVTYLLVPVPLYSARDVGVVIVVVTERKIDVAVAVCSCLVGVSNFLDWR